MIDIRSGWKVLIHSFDSVSAMALYLSSVPQTI